MSVPVAEVRRIRVETARELIVSTGDILAVIAEKVGVADEQQLSRLFRRQFGVAAGRLACFGARSLSKNSLEP